MNDTFLSGWGSASKVGIALVAATAITGGGMIAAESAQAAGFTGYYELPGTWNLSAANAILTSDESSVTLRNNSQITIDPLPTLTSFTFSFSINGSGAKAASYIANGVSTPFGGTSGPSAGGPITVNIVDTDSPIGFSYNSATGSLFVENFILSETTPIPTPAMLPGLIGAGLAFWRRKDSEEVSEEF